MRMALEIILAILLLAGAAIDLRSFRLPNWLTLATAILFVPWAVLTLSGLGQLGLHLLTGSLGLVVGSILFRFGALGGGDVKWLAALMLWLGPTEALLRFLVLVGFSGGLLGLILLLFVRLTGSSYGRFDGKQNLPYGVAIAIGGFDYWLRALPAGVFLKTLF
jgi:prepilin peptidase CpaA